MRLDHIVIHLDYDSTRLQTLATTLNTHGYPFNPGVGTRSREVRTSTINIGTEYIELVRILKPNAKTWMPLWSKNYDAGLRGAFCIFLESEDAERLGSNLKRAGIQARGPATLAYPGLFGLIRRNAPYYIYYMPLFPDSALHLAIITYKNKQARDAAFASLTPNSTNYGTNAIRRLEIELPRLDESIPMLTKMFPDLHQENGEWITKLEQLRMVFRLSPTAETNLRVRTITTSRAFVGKKLQIENVELITAGG